MSLALLVGLRSEVGGDWFNYLRYLFPLQGLDLSEVLAREDPAYQFLNWTFMDEPWAIYAVNAVGGVFFATGLTVFCLHQPRPWLALAIAIPYLVIVVAMGYTRQGIALAFEMIALVALSKKSTTRFVIWIAVAATFHKSAVLILPIAALAATRNRWWTAAWVGLAALLLYYLLVSSAVDRLYDDYVEAQYQSEGAIVRLAMNALPALIFLAFGRRFVLNEAERRLWNWFAILSLLLLVVLMTTSASTAIDRVALYVLPLQLVVFSRIPDAMGRAACGRAIEGTAKMRRPEWVRFPAVTGNSSPALCCCIMEQYSLFG